MRLKKIVASTALAVAASAGAILVTAGPAAAELPSITVPGMSRIELMWLCAENNGNFEDGLEYECYLPNGSIIICRQGENCRVILVRPPSDTPTTPIDERATTPVTPTAR